MKTRDDLQALLNSLEADLPGMLERNPDPADFWPEFAGRADEIVDGAGPDDHDWATAKVDELLALHGLLASPEGLTPN